MLNGPKGPSCWKFLLHLLSSLIAWQKVINSKVSTCKKLAITNSNGTPTYLSIDLAAKTIKTLKRKGILSAQA
ncbi:50S ribosomal protein L28 [Mycoplasmopsis bovis]|nr:50S ribosomal protein L28 [Mycoplasmopsis bovis]